MIRCICVDDEPMARKGIALALKPFSDFELVSSFSSGEDLLDNYPENIDVLFVDIEMPRINGFELLKKLPEPLPLIVFITAYDQYAIKAFEAEALDYVLKPIEEERFSQVVIRIKKALGQPQDSRKSDKLLKMVNALQQKLNRDEATISVKTDDGYFRIKLCDLLYIESVGDHVCFHLTNQQLISRSTLKSLVVELAEHGFQQVHKSSLVNEKHVIKLDKLRFSDYQIELSNRSLLRVSRRYRSAIEHFKR
jgi:two-component system LytT family response regulator